MKAEKADKLVRHFYQILQNDSFNHWYNNVFLGHPANNNSVEEIYGDIKNLFKIKIDNDDVPAINNYNYVYYSRIYTGNVIYRFPEGQDEGEFYSCLDKAWTKTAGKLNNDSSWILLTLDEAMKACPAAFQVEIPNEVAPPQDNPIYNYYNLNNTLYRYLGGQNEGEYFILDYWVKSSCLFSSYADKFQPLSEQQAIEQFPQAFQEENIPQHFKKQFNKPSVKEKLISLDEPSCETKYCYDPSPAPVEENNVFKITNYSVDIYKYTYFHHIDVGNNILYRFTEGKENPKYWEGPWNREWRDSSRMRSESGWLPLLEKEAIQQHPAAFEEFKLNNNIGAKVNNEPALEENKNEWDYFNHQTFRKKYLYRFNKDKSYGEYFDADIGNMWEKLHCLYSNNFTPISLEEAQKQKPLAFKYEVKVISYGDEIRYKYFNRNDLGDKCLYRFESPVSNAEWFDDKKEEWYITPYLTLKDKEFQWTAVTEDEAKNQCPQAFKKNEVPEHDFKWLTGKTNLTNDEQKNNDPKYRYFQGRRSSKIYRFQDGDIKCKIYDGLGWVKNYIYTQSLLDNRRRKFIELTSEQAKEKLGANYE